MRCRMGQSRQFAQERQPPRGPFPDKPRFPIPEDEPVRESPEPGTIRPVHPPPPFTPPSSPPPPEPKEE